MTRYFLGLDWGKAKVGVALADSETRMAFAHGIIKNDARCFEKISTLLNQYSVERIIIGVPFHISQKESAEQAKSFGSRLEKKTVLPVEYFSEMFTTKMAQSNLMEGGHHGKEDDAEAARIILQGWLDIHR